MMTAESIYFLFSVCTVFIVSVHILNLVFLKLKHRNILGKTFKKGTRDYEYMLKSISPRYLRVTALSFLLSLINLAFAAHEVFQSFEHQKAVNIISILTLMTLTTVIWVVLTLNDELGENPERRSTARHNDDADW